VLVSIFVTGAEISADMPMAVAQPAASPQVIKGDLLSIKGEVYVVRDIFGRLVRLRVNKDTKRERLVVPGEKVEVEMMPDGRALSIKPAK
jgi:hypothetical protein